MNAKRKIIIDCDTGIDDALALMLALASPELEVIGITAVCGNVPVDINPINMEEKGSMADYIKAQEKYFLAKE